MDRFKRYAIYYAPPATSGLAGFGASWLGWDPRTGTEVPHPAVPGLPRSVDEITATPRKYGLHGTLKPPFRLAEGTTVAGLHDRLTAHATKTAAFMLDGLQPMRLGRFVALVPMGNTTDLAAFAANLVQDFDDFRAPLNEAELAKRRASGLSPRQEELLTAWGYPYVLEEFRFHLTLSGALPQHDADTLVAALNSVVSPHLTAPWLINEVCLFGEAEDGRFHILHRYALTG